jgi:hypothetical protein
MRTRNLLPLIAAAALLSACGADQSASPTPPPDVNVSTSVSSVSALVVQPPVSGDADLECNVTLLSEVVGTGQGTWLDGIVEFTDLRDSTTSFGSIPVSAVSLKILLGGDAIRGGQSVTSHWRVSGSTSFGVAVRIRYQAPSAIRTTSAWAPCARPSGAPPAPVPEPLAPQSTSGEPRVTGAYTARLIN